MRSTRRLQLGALFVLSVLVLGVWLAGPAEAHHEKAPAQLPIPNGGGAAVWTGDEAVLFPGGSCCAKPIVHVDGNATTVRESSATTGVWRYSPAAVWDGHHAYLFGGHTSYEDARRTLRYDPATEEAVLLQAELPGALVGMSAVIDGPIAYLFGGERGPTCDVPLRDDIVAYDTRSDQFTMLFSKLPSPREGTSAVWTGEHAFIFGGLQASSSCTASYLDQIVRFTPATGEVTVMDATLPFRTHGTTAYWDGQYAYVVSGAGCRGIARYDPVADEVTPLWELHECFRRSPAVWTGERALLLGGDLNWPRGDTDAITLHPPNDSTPSAPRDVAATTGPGLDEITLAWSPPRHDGGPSITAYHVERVLDDGGVEALAVVPGGQVSFTHTGLATGEVAHYRVVAENALGDSEPSAVATGHAPRWPDAPPGLFANVGPGAGEIDLHWSAPANDGGRPIMVYRLYRTGPHGVEALVVETGARGHFDTGLADATVYEYRVSAVNELGEGEKSAVRTVRSPALPSAPPGLSTTTGPAAGAVTLTWGKPADTGGLPIYYRVYRAAPGGPFELVHVTDVRWQLTTTWADEGLPHGAVRLYRVAAVNEVGEGAHAGPIEGVTPSLPGPVTTLEASAGAGSGTVLLAWRLPEDTGGVPVGSFVVERAGPGEAPVVLANLSAEARGYADRTAPPGAVAVYTVRAVNVVGEGPSAEPVSATARVLPGANAREAVLVSSNSAPQPAETLLDHGGAVTFVALSSGPNPRDQSPFFGGDSNCFDFRLDHGRNMRVGDTYTLTFQYLADTGRLLVSTDETVFRECPATSFVQTPTSAVIQYRSGPYYAAEQQGTIEVLAAS